MSHSATVLQKEKGEKKRRHRSPSVPKPAFVVVQVLGDDGQPQSFDKKRLKIVTVERSAEKVMEMIEDGQVENALYLRIMVPVNKPQRAQAQAA